MHVTPLQANSTRCWIRNQVAGCPTASHMPVSSPDPPHIDSRSSPRRRAEAGRRGRAARRRRAQGQLVREAPAAAARRGGRVSGPPGRRRGPQRLVPRLRVPGGGARGGEAPGRTHRRGRRAGDTPAAACCFSLACLRCCRPRTMLTQTWHILCLGGSPLSLLPEDTAARYPLGLAAVSSHCRWSFCRTSRRLWGRTCRMSGSRCWRARPASTASEQPSCQSVTAEAICSASLACVARCSSRTPPLQATLPPFSRQLPSTLQHCRHGLH